MSICKPGFKQRILAFLLVLALFLILCEDVHRASALALTATTGALAVGAFLLISAGVVFATTGDLRKGTDAFLKAYPETLKWCEDRAKSIVGGVVTLLPDMAAGMMTLASKAAEFFKAGSVDNTVSFDDISWHPNKLLNDSLRLADSNMEEIWTKVDDYTVGLTARYRSSEGGTIHRTVKFNSIWAPYEVVPVTAYYSRILVGNFSPGFSTTVNALTPYGNLTSGTRLWAGHDLEVDYPGDGNWHEFTATYRLYHVPTGTVSEDVPFSWSPTYPGADVYRGYQKELSGTGVGTGTGTGALTMDLTKTGVMDDVSKPELTLPLTATQAGVVASTGTTPTSGDVLPPDPGGGTVNVDGLKLPDLRDVFPFCVPFDLINLVSALDAEPKAPVFKVPVDFGFAGYSEEVSIDFSRFDKVAAALRWGETLLFIAGLILITRKIIQG